MGASTDATDDSHGTAGGARKESFPGQATRS